jgi:hypothetical protein
MKAARRKKSFFITDSINLSLRAARLAAKQSPV